MKINFMKFGFFTVVLALSMFLTSCDNNKNHDHDHQHQSEQHQHDAEHDHEGHQHEQQHEEEGEESSSVDKTGKEYTSAYVCPMRCEGSGSESPGNCPKCKMVYVENTEK